MAEPPTLVVVGAATRDVDARDPRGWRLGGGVTYSSLAAARVGVKVRALIGVDGTASNAHELGLLADGGVELQLVQLERGPVFDNRETPSGRVQYAQGPSDPVPTEALPQDWRSPTAAVLAPVAAEIGDDWATAFGGETLVAVAAQGLVRNLTPGVPITARPLTRTVLVERSKAMLISAEDAANGTPPLIELLHPGQELVATRGAAGALYVRHQANRVSLRYVPPLPPRVPVDSTGAGDVFLGAWMAACVLLGEAQAWRALAVASAMASLSVRGPSLAAIPTKAELCDVLVRLRDRHLG